MRSESEDKAKAYQMLKVEADEYFQMGGRQKEKQPEKVKKRAGRINERSEKVIGLEDKVDGRWTDTGNKAEGEKERDKLRQGTKRMRGSKWGHFMKMVEE